MARIPQALFRLALTLILAAACLNIRGDRNSALQKTMAFPKVMPRLVVWAWEEPEDLRAAPSATTGVAYLAETLLLDGSVENTGSAEPKITILSRHQPLAVAPDVPVMAVVRVMTLDGRCAFLRARI